MSMVEETSTAEDPDRANQITQAALTSSVTPAGKIAQPPETFYELPGGYLDQQGGLHRKIEVRELTGADEEALSRIDTLKHPAEYLKTLVLRGTVALDGEPFTEGLLGMLLVGDRDAAILAIRRATFGDQLPMKIQCPTCEFEDDIILELDKDVPMRTMKDPSERVLKLSLRSGEVEVVLPTVHVSDAVQGLLGKTQAERNTLILQRCLLSIDGQAPSPQAVLDLPLADRKALIKALDEAQPGPQYGEVRVSCAHCKSESPLLLTLDTLFRG